LEHRPDLDVTVVPHLYDLAPDGPGMEFLRSVAGDMIVLAWLYPRAAYWVLDANRVRGRLGRTSSLPEEDAEEPPRKPGSQRAQPDRTIWCFDLRTHPKPEPYLEEIERIVQGAAVPAVQVGAAWPSAGNGKARVLEEATRPRWYPVLDFARCDGCLECLNFCLFGVYGPGERDAPLVEQPDACRNGCPACSRVCPQGAIMFPQHKDPAIAGDPRASREGLKLDLSQLFGGAGPSELAAAERKRALADNERPQQEPGPAQTPDRPPGDELDRLVDGLDDLKL
jgi:hypothetical protein